MISTPVDGRRFGDVGRLLPPTLVRWAWSVALALLVSCSPSNVDGRKAIHRVPVSSSAQRSVGYDSNRAILEVEFENGAVYQYFGVPAQVHQGLMAADSHARYFHSKIRNAGFRYRRTE